MSEDELFELQHLSDPPKFLADENVKGLARWMRFLGYDTIIAQGSDEVVRIETQRSGRCLITRDAELATQLRHHALLMKSDVVEEQLKFVLKHLPPTDPNAWFSRCVECNEHLQELDRSEIQSDAVLPNYVKSQPDIRAWHCPNCGRSYWKGSHVERMRGYFTEILQNVHA